MFAEKQKWTLRLLAGCGLALMTLLSTPVFPVPGQTAMRHVVQQLHVAQTYAARAERADSLPHMQREARQVLNVLVGEGGWQFSPNVPNPGDGHGVRPYLVDFIEQQTHDVATLIEAYSSLHLPDSSHSRVVLLTNIVLTHIVNAIHRAGMVIAVKDSPAARAQLQQLRASLEAAIGTSGSNVDTAGAAYLDRLLTRVALWHAAPSPPAGGGRPLVAGHPVSD